LSLSVLFFTHLQVNSSVFVQLSPAAQADPPQLPDAVMEQAKAIGANKTRDKAKTRMYISISSVDAKAASAA